MSKFTQNSSAHERGQNAATIAIIKRWQEVYADTDYLLSVIHRAFGPEQAPVLSPIIAPVEETAAPTVQTVPNEVAGNVISIAGAHDRHAGNAQALRIEQSQRAVEDSYKIAA